MQKVSKIVPQRLKAATPSVNHPDANELTAFSEGSLPEIERAVVLEHLARCLDCRDIVALSLPATEAVQTTVSPSPARWLTWPALRWGFVAAGVVAIVSLGVVRYQKHVPTERTAAKSPAGLQVAANESKKEIAPFVDPNSAEKRDKLQSPSTPPLPDSEEATSAIGNQKKIVAQAGKLPVPVPPAAAGIGSSSGARFVVRALPHGGPALANQWQQQNTFQNQASAPAPSSDVTAQQAATESSANRRVPASSEMVEVESAAVELDAQGKNVNALKDQAAAPQLSANEYDSPPVGKAKPAMPTQAARGAAVQSTLVTSTPSQAVVAGSVPSPRWAITSAGALQRSFDQGNTWQTVDVNASPASSLGETSVEVTTATPPAARKDKEKTLRREGPPLTFRAVTATGPDVWAGGSSLYHSVDAGNHWTRVVPASPGAVLTGDILSLEFRDAQHGTVTTSAAEVWTTSDDGQNWQKQ